MSDALWSYAPHYVPEKRACSKISPLQGLVQPRDDPMLFRTRRILPALKIGRRRFRRRPRRRRPCSCRHRERRAHRGQCFHGRLPASFPSARSTSLRTSLSRISFDASPRIGEADNLGPYFVGGSSASGHSATAMPGHFPLQQISEADHSVDHAFAEQVLDYFTVVLICRDVNFQHQSAVRWFYAHDVAEVVQEELCCEEWNRDGLDDLIRMVFEEGAGVVDPAKLIIGESDFGKDDDLYGWETGQQPLINTYANLAPVSDPVDRLARQRALRADTVAELLQEMNALGRLRGGALIGITGLAAPPEVEEEVCSDPPQLPTPQSGSESTISVGPAAIGARLRGPKRNRRAKVPPQKFAWPEHVEQGSSQLTDESGGITRRRVERGSRGKRAQCELVILNSSGPPQLRAALLSCDPEVTAIMNQEHQCRGSSYVDLQYEAKSLGWNLQGSQAAQSSLEGVSAGVCVASRTAVGRGLIHGKADLSPRVSPGRFTAAWLQIGPDTGIVVGSVYLYHSEYASIRNRKLLEHAVAVLSAYGSPWILGGDYNLPPQDILHLFPHVLEQANAYVFATELPTHCPTAGQHRTLDYLICSSAACQWIGEVYVDYSIAAAPHRALRIKLRAYRHNFTVECSRSPKQFPRYKPIGCSRSLVVPRGVSAAVASSLEVCGYATSVESPSETWPALAHAIETELCRVIDSVDSNGLAQPAYSGRARGVRTSQMLVLPRRASASLGKVDEVAHALNWLAVRISEIAAISTKVKAGILLSDGAKRQWSAIMSKSTAQKGLALIVRRVSVEWNTLLESVAYHKPGQDSEWLRRVAELAREDAVAHKKQHCEIRAESWKAHVARQLKNGAAVTHRWIKRDSVDPVAVDTVGEGKNRSASPQAIVNQDLQMWKAVWCRPGIEGDAPWRCEVVGEELPLIRAEDISRAARSFKPVTSIGCDSIPPRAMGWISDELSGEIARFLNSVEQVGRWPPAISTSLVHLIPLPRGGRRLIGLENRLRSNGSGSTVPRTTGPPKAGRRRPPCGNVPCLTRRRRGGVYCLQPRLWT